MRTSATSASNRTSQPQKHKAACDQCNASKVKCPGGGPPCNRCSDSSQHCHYSLARRIGKPPGSKNRKTLERLRQVKEGNLESISGGGGDASISQNSGNTNDRDGPLNIESEQRKGDYNENSLHVPSTTNLWPLSPLIDYPNFPETLEFALAPEQETLNGDHRMYSHGGDKSVSHRSNVQLPDFEGLGREESRRLWADAPDDCWSPSSTSIDQRLFSDPVGTDSPLSANSHSPVFETNKSTSLDSVATRLEETASSKITHAEKGQPTLCRCLRKYADVLCKLQIIEKRQHPIQVDTLLTCANLVLNTTEDQLKCTQCFYDPCVAMQLVMIFQTILTWSQGQCYSSGTFGPGIRVTLGQHEMTEEECNFVKTALISKALDRTSALLKLMIPRIKHATLNGQAKQLWGYEGAEFWNLQQLVNSLIQSIGVLTKRLTSAQPKSHQVVVS